jgi:beta-phosphoglucomutase-like phosphatase (HAD superfamily)
MGLRSWFQALATRESAAQGKPAPDLYLAAARLLGVEPQRCLAVEDSPVGLQAAVAAGMGCLIITPPTPAISGSGGVPDTNGKDYSLALAKVRSLPELSQCLLAFLQNKD